MICYAKPRKSVLVIEDHEATFRGVELMLEELVDVDWIQTPSTVKEVSLNNYSCFILDLGLPEPIVGIHTLLYLKHNYPRIPIVVVSGFSDLRLASLSIKSGAEDFIQKPINSERLTNFIQSSAASLD